MKNILLLLVLILLGCKYSMSDTLTVAQDGTGDFIHIMQAIVVVNDGDVIIVEPGTYYENINFIGRSFTLASTYLLNPADSLRHQTIIDGSGTGSCIRITSGEQNCRIVGFTLQNGSGSSINNNSNNGGGIYFRDCTATLEKCIIKNNAAVSGAGLTIWNANIHLIANTIKNNLADLFGGGIYIETNSSVIFDSLMLNSIYLNYSQLGTDICKYYESATNHIILDTATVKNLNHYYLDAINSNMFPVTGNMTYEANHGIVEQANCDIYVSPTGNNSNNGLLPTEPLQTIAYALAKIVSDSIVNNTIHLAPGTYSSSATGEKFPLCFKSNVPIIGAGMNETILDVEYKINMGRIGRDEEELQLKSFSITKTNGYNNPFSFGGLWINYIKKLNLDSLHFQFNRSYYKTCTNIYEVDSVLITNCVFNNNDGYAHMHVGNSFRKKNTFFSLRSNIFQNNTPDSTRDGSHALVVNGLEYLINGNGNIHGNIVNCLITDNESYTISLLPATVGILIAGHVNTKIVNSTIGNNILDSQNGAAITIGSNSNTYLYNSIVYGNMPHQICLINNTFDQADSLYVYNTCIEDGQFGIFDYGQYNFVYYDEASNINKDPEWFGQGDLPYAISFNSPCIDAGTLNLPEGVVLPEYDLAGNPRIWGTSIDMGAYEWWPVGTDEYSEPIVRQKLLKAAPNPFATSTIISASFPVKSHVKLDIYNNNGLRVKALMDEVTLPGASHIVWLGDDYNNQALPMGIYHVVMFVNEKEVENVKLIKN